MNNTTMHTADRATHVKIVVVSLIASIAVVVIGISARGTQTDIPTARFEASAPVVKAGKPLIVTRTDATAIR